MHKFDNQFRNFSKQNILGIDEVGRGCIAGPLVVAGVILNPNYKNPLINDSKKLSKLKREFLYQEIINNVIAYEIVFVNVDTIDQINILQATKQAMLKIASKLKDHYDLVLTDYERLDLNVEQHNITKGDAKSLSIAAASILAKVSRDKFMIEQDQIFPEYGFKTNVGYGTKKHLDAVYKAGICELHRKSFEPIKSLILKNNNN